MTGLQELTLSAQVAEKLPQPAAQVLLDGGTLDAALDALRAWAESKGWSRRYAYKHRAAIAADLRQDPQIIAASEQFEPSWVSHNTLWSRVIKASTEGHLDPSLYSANPAHNGLSWRKLADNRQGTHESEQDRLMVDYATGKLIPTQQRYEQIVAEYLLDTNPAKPDLYAVDWAELRRLYRYSGQGTGPDTKNLRKGPDSRNLRTAEDGTTYAETTTQRQARTAAIRACDQERRAAQTAEQHLRAELARLLAITPMSAAHQSELERKVERTARGIRRESQEALRWTAQARDLRNRDHRSDHANATDHLGMSDADYCLALPHRGKPEPLPAVEYEITRPAGQRSCLWSIKNVRSHGPRYTAPRRAQWLQWPEAVIPAERYELLDGKPRLCIRLDELHPAAKVRTTTLHRSTTRTTQPDERQSERDQAAAAARERIASLGATKRAQKLRADLQRHIDHALRQLDDGALQDAHNRINRTLAELDNLRPKVPTDTARHYSSVDVYDWCLPLMWQGPLRPAPTARELAADAESHAQYLRKYPQQRTPSESAIAATEHRLLLSRAPEATGRRSECEPRGCAPIIRTTVTGKTHADLQWEGYIARLAQHPAGRAYLRATQPAEPTQTAQETPQTDGLGLMTETLDELAKARSRARIDAAPKAGSATPLYLRPNPAAGPTRQETACPTTPIAPAHAELPVVERRARKTLTASVTACDMTRALRARETTDTAREARQVRADLYAYLVRLDRQRASFDAQEASDYALDGLR